MQISIPDLYPGDWSTLAIQTEHRSVTRARLRGNLLCAGVIPGLGPGMTTTIFKRKLETMRWGAHLPATANP